ncbi:nucleotidyltransferase domain-containing protein [Candidatus Woesearchaeota archaeon]|nr:nucleotidyltransferase domain-containing protein [Candidatus Woesearchaeota archaeon]
MRKLKAQTVNALAYCFDLLSFIFQNPDAGRRIKSVYLFGSAVRGELEKSSDIDLFIECEKEDEKQVRSLVDSGILKFTVSQDYQKWKLFRFTYPFSVQIGQVAEWELKLSIASEGILLYNRAGILSAGERQVLFMINYSKKKKEYIKVRRLIFGRDESYYRGTGLLHKYKGQRISANVFIVPQEYQGQMIEVLSKEKVLFSMKEIVVLE